MSTPTDKAEWPTFAQVAKVEEVLVTLDELKGKYSKADKVEVQKRGSKDPVKVTRFAALICQAVKNKYAPTKDEVLQCGLSLVATTPTTSGETVDDASEVADADAEPAAEPEKAPDVPTAVTRSAASAANASVSLEHSDIVVKVSESLGIEIGIVQKVTEAFISHLSGSYLLGLVALANSLQFIAKAHDKLPGHDARMKAIDDLRKQYVEAGTLTVKKSR